jgi:hypothetical protein
MNTMDYYFTGFPLWLGDLSLCLALDPTILKQPKQLCLIGGYNDRVVDHLEFNLVEPLAMTICSNIEAQCCTIGLPGQRQSYQ